MASQSHWNRSALFVCRWLHDRGVLARVAGDEEGFVSQDGDVLYDVRRRVLALLPGSVRGASLIHADAPTLSFDQRLAALNDEFVADSDAGRRTSVRHRLARRLLDDPVVYVDELDNEERGYFANQRGPLTARLAGAVGLAVVLRAEGAALIDADGELSDDLLPAQGTDAHATLLVAEYIAMHARGGPRRWHELAELAAHLAGAMQRYGRFWRKSAREPGAEHGLLEQALVRLDRLRLVQRTDDRVQAWPALLRFALAADDPPTDLFR